MNADRFDQATKLASAGTRRGIVAGLFGGVLGAALGLAETEAAKKKHKKSKKGKKKGKKGKKQAEKCTLYLDCPSAHYCANGRCTPGCEEQIHCDFLHGHPDLLPQQFCVNGQCQASCVDEHGVCPLGSYCANADSAGIRRCVSGCINHFDCELYWYCNAGTCEPPECMKNADCASNICNEFHKCG